MSWTCPKCERELKSENQWHNCVKVSMDSLFEGKAEELVLVFDKLLVEIMGWQNTLVSATQNCIVFVHNQTFLVIRPMKKELDIKFYSETEQPKEYPLVKSIFYSGRYTNHIRISSPEALTQKIMKLLKQSYDLLQHMLQPVKNYFLGLDACNIFARVFDKDRLLLEALGNEIWKNGTQELFFDVL